MSRSGLRRARRAWQEVSDLDQQIGGLVDNIPYTPKLEISLAQLETAKSHLVAASRLLAEVQRREAPQYDEALDPA